MGKTGHTCPGENKNEKKTLTASWCKSVTSNSTIKIEENPPMENDEFPAYEVKNNTLKISIAKRYFNDEFQHCFNYHARNESSNDEIRTNIQCKLGYYRKGISDDCENGTVAIEDSIDCNYIENDSEKTLNFDLKVHSNVYEQRNVHNFNIMCIIETKHCEKQKCKQWSVETNARWKKYHFLQQFAIDLSSRIKRSISDETSKNTTPTYVSVSVICILLLVFASGIYVRRWRKSKTIRDKTSELNSKSGNTSTYDQLVNLSFEMSESHIEEQPMTNNIYSPNKHGSTSCPDCSALNTLPKTIAELEDILYPRCTVDMEEKLGYGNYGSVLKGYLRMGKAR